MKKFNHLNDEVLQKTVGGNRDSSFEAGRLFVRAIKKIWGK